jgi:hypothetical protein
MEPNDITFGTEALEFMKTYRVREDALRYARANPALENPIDGEDVIEVFGHDPDGNRYRFMCEKDRPSHILTFRPVPDDA